MKKVTFILLIFSLLNMGYACSSDKGKQTPDSSVSIIFDTDMGPDYDDVGALTILHALADSGEARILATVSSNRYELTAPCIEIINNYYGRPELPVGAPVTGPYQPDGWHAEQWTKALVDRFPHTIRATEETPDAVQIYRRILAGEPDTSVVVVTVGFLTNLAALLQSPPDQYSDLDGKQLVAKKVKRLVSMAGGFPQGRQEYNVHVDSLASVTVFEQWTAPIIFSGSEIGEKILTGKRLIASNIQNTPANVAFTICLRQDNPEGRQSWDETAVLVAVRGSDKYFNTVRGRIIVHIDGSNTWEDDPNGKHEYLTWKMPLEELTRIIEDLMMHEK
jgi:inosine-uridine nucleoside N-ribohydrolase